MLNIIDANKIIFKHQFGFRKRHSTQQAITTLLEKITGAWESDDLVIGVFLDLKKLFETVPNNILLKKLHAYGICGDALKLLKSCLTDQNQYVIYDGLRSGTKPVQC